jgi:uroporphyrinogen decarboxylase
MTPRERVLLALEHRPTDRAPADFAAAKSVTRKLIEKLGVADEDELLAALHVDMRRIWFWYEQPHSEPDAQGYRRTMWGAKRREQDPGDGLASFVSPFTEDTTVEAVHAHNWPDPDSLDCSEVAPQCDKYHGEYATFGAPWSPFFHEAGWLIGQENLFLWMATKPDVVHAILQHIVDFEIAATRLFLEAAGGRIDIAYFGNDFGTQRGLVISPRMWHEFYRKPLKRFFDLSHDFGCKVMKHSCGAVRDIIPFLVADGVDILDPIQVGAAGMDLPGLVRDFGQTLCFHGGVDTQRTLPFGSTEDVRAEVRSHLDLTRDRGGYILCGSQSFIDDIPLDNILAMYEENRAHAQA